MSIWNSLKIRGSKISISLLLKWIISWGLKLTDRIFWRFFNQKIKYNPVSAARNFTFHFIRPDYKELSEEAAETASSALSMASRRSCRSFRGASLGVWPRKWGLGPRGDACPKKVWGNVSMKKMQKKQTWKNQKWHFLYLPWLIFSTSSASWKIYTKHLRRKVDSPTPVARIEHAERPSERGCHGLPGENTDVNVGLETKPKTMPAVAQNPRNKSTNLNF